MKTYLLLNQDQNYHSTSIISHKLNKGELKTQKQYQLKGKERDFIQ